MQKHILAYQNKIKELSVPDDFSANIVSVPDLFAHYKDVNFLYPEKNNKIEPFMPLIERNWQAARRAEKEILWTLMFNNPEIRSMGSVTFWRSTKNDWVAQHLTSSGYPSAVLAMVLTAQVEGMEKGCRSIQNWFQPSNKYAAKVFGSIVNTVGDKYSAVQSFDYFEIGPKSIKKNTKIKNFAIKKCVNQKPSGIYNFAKKVRGDIYALAENLDNEDIELKDVDNLYQKYGLSRKRHIWMAFYKSKPVGAIIAYRGPFGFNFSLFENRCDLLIDNNLEDDMAQVMCAHLIKEASKAYPFGTKKDYPLHCLNITIEKSSSHILEQMGAKKIRSYNQSICMNEGFEKWFGHVEKIYLSVMKIMEKRYKGKFFPN